MLYWLHFEVNYSITRRILQILLVRASGWFLRRLSLWAQKDRLKEMLHEVLICRNFWHSPGEPLQTRPPLKSPESQKICEKQLQRMDFRAIFSLPAVGPKEFFGHFSDLK